MDIFRPKQSMLQVMIQQRIYPISIVQEEAGWSSEVDMIICYRKSLMEHSSHKANKYILREMMAF